MTPIEQIVVTIIFFLCIYILWRLLIGETLINILVSAILTTMSLELLEVFGDVLFSIENEYPQYVYNKYRIHRMKKQLGVIYKFEPFIWTDEQEDEELKVAYEYTMTEH